MNLKSTNPDELENLKPAFSPGTILLIFLAIIAGSVLAAVVLPAMLPGLAQSLLGTAPKAFWYLSRSSAIAAYALLWLSMIFGLIITNRMARLWPGGPTAYDLHQFTSLLGLAFALFHALILLGDHFINYNLAQILVPFASVNFKPFWVGIGQIGFYLWIIVAFSFYVRKQMGTRTWRLIHYASFLSFGMALLHGILSGTDTATTWAGNMYWISGGILLFFFIYRVLVVTFKQNPARGSAA